MQKKLSLALAAALATLGLCAGLFAFPAHADNPNGATSLKDLQALGYGLGHVADIPNHPLCFYWVVMYGNGAPWTVIGEPDQTTGSCATDPAVVQQRIDALIAAYPPQPATTATVPVTTAAPDPTTTATTTAETVPATTTVAAPEAPPAQTVTVTTTVVVTDPTVNDRLTALEQRQQTDEARIQVLEAKAGIIVGEPKNTAPFTNQV